MCVLAGRQTFTFPAAGNQMREWPVSHHCCGLGNGPLEENISDKIYRPEQCSREVQRPAERMQLSPKASVGLSFPGALWLRLTALRGELRLRGIIKMTRMRLSMGLQTRQSCLCLVALTTLLPPGSRMHHRLSNLGLN